MHDHKHSLHVLKNALGQLEAVIKMTEENRYCIDISTQISATIALLKKAQRQILSEHLSTCVQESIDAQDAKAKIEEINQVLSKLI